MTPNREGTSVSISTQRPALAGSRLSRRSGESGITIKPQGTEGPPSAITSENFSFGTLQMIDQGLNRSSSKVSMTGIRNIVNRGRRPTGSANVSGGRSNLAPLSTETRSDKLRRPTFANLSPLPAPVGPTKRIETEERRTTISDEATANLFLPTIILKPKEGGGHKVVRQFAGV